MLTLPAFVEMSGYTWETGKQIVDIQVTLGSAEKSSSCKVTLSDPMHIIASALINHSIKSGGIVALPDVNKAPDIVLPKTGKDNGKGEGAVSEGQDYDAVTKAFLDTIMKREIPEADLLTRKGYYAANQSSTPDFTDADIAAGGGFPASAVGSNSNVGRYQLSRDEWDEAAKAGVIKRAFDPATQDAIAVYRLKAYNKGWKQLRAGDIKGALQRARTEWVSIPGGSQANPGATMKEYLDYYELRLAFHQKNGGSTTAVGKQVAPVKTFAPPPPTVTSTPIPVIKGSLMRVNIGSFDFSFYHQGTEMSEQGTTILTGQGIRWIMSRRVRSSTSKDISLKQLATKIAQSHKLSLDYQATIDPKYSHIDQSGISDYALLQRECEQSGLMVTEEKSTIVIKERKQLGLPKLTMARGDNLISYTINDKALTGNEPEIAKDLPQSSKSVLDPITGKQVAIKPDVDRAGSISNTTTGKTKQTTAGKIAGSNTNVAEVEKGKTKRIGGLPSVFVIPLSILSLTVTPLCTVSTAFLTPVLNRIWVVKTVQHDVGKGTTTINATSPVEVKNLNPDPIIPNKVAPTTAETMGKGWIYPVTGTITSLWSRARLNPSTGIVKPHRGVDIGAPIGTPVYAADGGVVVLNAYDDQGGGNFLRLLHDNGYKTQYLHMRDKAIPLVGTRVARGEQIGFVGNTGIGTGAHLHFELFKVDSATRENPGLVFKQLRSLGQSTVAKAPC